MAKRTRKKQPHSNSWFNQFNDIIRGVSGGFLFGIPLLYTMEVWWIGSQLSPPIMLAILATTFVVVFLLNHTEGFRKNQSKKFLDTVMDSFEALAIGILCASCILVLLGEITQETPLNEALGKLILESVPFSLGAALASAFLSGDRWSSSNNQDADKQGNPANQKDQLNFNATVADIGATLIGAMIIAFNIAPTDEIPMLNAAIAPPRLLAIIAVSLVISYGIVFEAGFTTQQKRRQQKGIFQRPISETVMSYLVSLFASAFMLFFFHRLSLDDHWMLWLSNTLILGLPATIGGAAGRPSDMNDTDSSSQVEQKPPRSPAEWTTFSIALLIVTVIVGLVIYKWLTQKHQPPVLSINSSSEIREAPGQFYVPFSVTNTGGETAESVQVIAELRVNGEVEENGEQQIDFLASGEKEEGAFVFSRDPREGELVVRVASYKLP